MLVTYTNTSHASTEYRITLAAKAGKITRILRVEGARKTTTVLEGAPSISMTNCMNADGTTFTATYRAEEEGGGSGGFPRQARCILFDPPWRVTVKPGEDSLISYASGVTGANTAQLIVGYQYE